MVGNNGWTRYEMGTSTSLFSKCAPCFDTEIKQNPSLCYRLIASKREIIQFMVVTLNRINHFIIHHQSYIKPASAGLE